MRSVASGLPKTLIPVRGTPFADLQLAWLRSEGVTRVVYSTGHLGDLIRRHVGDGSRFGLRVAYVDEGPNLRGTGGALRLVVDSGLAEDTFLVLNGDSYLRLNLHDLSARLHESGLPVVMSVLRNGGRWDRSNAVVRDGRVVLYDKGVDPSPPEMEWIDYGVSAMTAGAVREGIPPDTVADVADLMHALSIAGRLGAFEATERFYEIGSPSGIRDLEKHLQTREAGQPS